MPSEPRAKPNNSHQGYILKASSYWDGRAGSYDGLFDLSPTRIQVQDHLLSQIPLPLTKAVLDLGAGTGRLAREFLLRFRDARYHLLDVSPAMLARARRRLAGHGGAQFVHGQLDHLPFPRNSMSLVVSTFAIHHVPDPVKPRVAQEIHRVLIPGGTFLCYDEVKPSTGAERDLESLIADVFYPGMGSGPYESLMTGLQEWPMQLADFVGLFEATGFKVATRRLNEIVAFLQATKPNRGTAPERPLVTAKPRPRGLDPQTSTCYPGHILT